MRGAWPEGSILNRATVLTDSIDRYAELCARLDDMFVPRAATLGAAGLDEQAWITISAEWAERLCASEGAALAERFGEVYAATRRRLRAPALLGAPEGDPQFMSTEAQAWRAEAARVSLDATGNAPALQTPDAEETWPSARANDALATVELGRLLPFAQRAALPFRDAGASEESSVRRVPALRRIYEPPIRPEVDATDSTERTIEVPVFAQRPPVIPFKPLRPSDRRLHRFDTQTGLPLTNPIWIEDAASADPTKPA
jgi:hypothetical protein